MKIVFNIKMHRLFAAFLALIILMSLNGCSVFDEIDETSNVQKDTTTQSSEEKLTVPINETGKTLYGLDNVDDESVRVLYGLIGQYADNRLEEYYFTVPGELSHRQLFEGICAYKEDHPEKFWLKNTCRYYYENGNTCVSLNFLMDYKTRISAQAELDEKVKEITANAPSNATQFELELYVHDYIIDNCEYDYESANSDEVNDNTGNAYGVLIEGEAVCEGYSRAFQLLCKELGLECVNVLGVSDDENHMWNCVMIDGQWYQIDVTWDDAEGEQKEITRYLFFNLNDENMYKDHQISEFYENISDDEYLNLKSNANLFVPQCTATEYNYHLYYGALITDIEDSDEIVGAIAQAAKDNRELFYLTSDSSLDFDEVSSKVIEGGYLAEWIDSANFKNFYSPNLNVQTEVYAVSEYNLLVVELKYT